MNLDRFRPPCECSMKHEKPESHPDDYKPQCECNKTQPLGAFKKTHWFSVGYAERKQDGTVRSYIQLEQDSDTFEVAYRHLEALRQDYYQRGIGVPKDEFCVIEHTETFYLV